MRWRNTETPTVAGSAGNNRAPAVVETMELLDRNGNVVLTVTKSVTGALTLITTDTSISGIGILTASRVIAGPDSVDSYGYHTFKVLNPSADDPVYGMGLNYEMYVDQESLAGNATGSNFYLDISQAGTPATKTDAKILNLGYTVGGNSHITHFEGMYVSGVISASVDDFYGIRLYPPSLDGGTVLQNHGLRIEDHSAVASGYNLVSKGASSKNLFEGTVTLDALKSKRALGTNADGNIIEGGAGTTTNDSAAAGYVGEFATGALASGSATSLTTTTAKTITSVSLTAGDWDVWGVVEYVPAATTTTAYVQQGASATDNTLGADGTYSACSGGNLTGTVLGLLIAENTPKQRVSLAATTTIYLVGKAGFAISTMTAFGSIFARRVR